MLFSAATCFLVKLTEDNRNSHSADSSVTGLGVATG